VTRIVVLSDIHGNLPALEAVLDDVRAQGTPDAYWVLGDLLLYLPWSKEVVDRLRALPHVSFVRGNIDRYVATGYRPPIPVQSPRIWARMPDLLDVRENRFRWTVERLAYDDWTFLRDLPTQFEVDLPGFGRVLAVHAVPGDDEIHLGPEMPGDQVRHHLRGIAVRLLLYGHIHISVDRTLDGNGLRLINPGSVGLPYDGDPRAAYVVLDVHNGSCIATVRRVSYDVPGVARELEQLDWAGRQHLIQILLRGRP